MMAYEQRGYKSYGYLQQPQGPEVPEVPPAQNGIKERLAALMNEQMRQGSGDEHMGGDPMAILNHLTGS